MKKFKKITLIILSTTLLVAFIGFLAACIVFEPKVKLAGFDSLSESKLGALNGSILITDNNNKEVDDSEMANSSLYIKVDSINQTTIDAFVSIEDKRFFRHNGVDYIRVAGAAIENLKHGSYKEGGSTISQQLIKNTHLSSKKTLKRKIEEIRIARELERKYSKEEILNMYLDSLYFGNGIYGIGTAAMAYFSKPASELNLSESATLAAIINSPSRYCPLTKRENCKKRRNLVLYRMLKNNKISKNEYDTAVDTELVTVSNSELFNQYFNNTISEAASILGCDTWDVRHRNLRIETSFDGKLSDYIESLYDELYIDNKDEIDFSCVVMDNNSASVMAFLGSGRRNYQSLRRSPGSTIKPIIAYAPALESRSVFPISPILDEKTSFNGYSPSNYQDKYHGYMTVEDSLCTSSNVAAVRLLDMCGMQYAKEIGENMGLTFGEHDNNLALALGGMQHGLTMQELASAYGTLASGGLYKEGSCIKRICDDKGNELYRDERMGKRAISRETAFLINNMLSKCANAGTARHLKGLKNVAAKTGTNGSKDGNTDAYCISYSTDYTVLVWMGAKKGYMPNWISGGTLPTRINKKVMQYLIKENGEASEFEMPSGIRLLYVDRESLEEKQKVVVANDMTPQIEKIPAYFDKRNLPIENSIKYFNKFLLYKDKNAFSA